MKVINVISNLPD